MPSPVNAVSTVAVTAKSPKPLPVASPLVAPVIPEKSIAMAISPAITTVVIPVAIQVLKIAKTVMVTMAVVVDTMLIVAPPIVFLIMVSPTVRVGACCHNQCKQCNQ